MMSLLRYNHKNPPLQRRPLPVSTRTLPGAPPRLPATLRTVHAAIATSGDNSIRVRLDTDSEHLATFFRLNWGEHASTEHAAARILALRATPDTYGLPPELADARWYCPATNQVWIVGSEYYGNLKITVRGLCSELAAADEMYVHGAAMAFQGRGVVLSGMSGAGKTTLTAALRRLAVDVRIINDDWGPLSLTTGRLRFTGEPHLHMKYPSVRALAPDLPIDPSRYPSEDFHGDPSDPHARLLVPAREVFGADGVCTEGALDLFVIVRRTPEKSPSAFMGATDVAALEQGQYSTFYDRSESFMNGSLFLMDEERRARQRALHARLLQGFRVVTLENSGSPDDGAELILAALASP